jgi:hypothetical protein
MNRRDHLLATAPRVAAWPFHSEHLIVDWSSSEPLRRADLPDDPRVRLLRVEGERRWSLCRAYNFAIAHCRGDRILKLDADCWPLEAFDPEAEFLRTSKPRLCAFGHGEEGQKGQFLIERALWEAVGGFNEVLIGYGFDDKDLRARLHLLLGRDPAPIPMDWLGVIPHSNEERMGQARAGLHQPLRLALGRAAMRSSRLGNRLLAAHCPWGEASSGCRYREEAPGLWRVDPASVPRPSPETADEIDHACRLIFWSWFLAIPEVFLAELPIKLVPPPRDGVWPVRWWHRLWWHTGRRVLYLPVQLLSLTRGRLEGVRRATARP